MSTANSAHLEKLTETGVMPAFSRPSLIFQVSFPDDVVKERMSLM